MSIDSQPLVSVVTPVYNGEKFLAECIESILAQTYENWEYIIVNNCSTDRSLEIAQSYTKKDPRIRIHNNSVFVNSLQNHNIAFRQISPASKYCKIVHADDWLFPECIWQMVKLAEDNPTIGIVGAYGLNSVEVSWDGLPYPRTVVSGRQICRETLLKHLYVFGTPTSILIRSDLIKNRKVLYNELNYHADKEICFDLLQQSDFGFVYQILTYTRRHDASRTSFAERFNTYLLGNLIILMKYGQIYLNEAEYKECLRLHMKFYYAFLAENLIYLRDKEVLNYHKNNLMKLEYPFSWTKLSVASFLEIIDLLFNPKSTIERIARKIIRVATESKVTKIK